MEQTYVLKDVSGLSERLPIPVWSDDKPEEIALNFEYFSCNIIGEGIVEDDFYSQNIGCDCSPGGCLENTCVCLKLFGPSYEATGILLPEVSNSFKTSSKPILECNSECKCDDTCFNRNVQHGIKYKLKIIKTKQKGFGLEAAESIPKFRFVCVYAGEVISYDEAKRRTSLQKVADMNYIIVVQEHVEGGKIIITCVDPTTRGNVGRFINHSCSPNLFMLPVRIDSPIPHLALFASRDIESGEELTFSYGQYANAEDSVCSGNKKPCFCGSPDCKVWLPSDPALFL